MIEAVYLYIFLFGDDVNSARRLKMPDQETCQEAVAGAIVTQAGGDGNSALVFCGPETVQISTSGLYYTYWKNILPERPADD